MVHKIKRIHHIHKKSRAACRMQMPNCRILRRTRYSPTVIHYLGIVGGGGEKEKEIEEEKRKRAKEKTTRATEYNRESRNRKIGEGKY
jgi:hypothetical protein